MGSPLQSRLCHSYEIGRVTSVTCLPTAQRLFQGEPRGLTSLGSCRSRARALLAEYSDISTGRTDHALRTANVDTVPPNGFAHRFVQVIRMHTWMPPAWSERGT